MKRLISTVLIMLTGYALSSLGGETLKVGPGKKFAKPSAAIKAAKDGDIIEIDAGGKYDGDVCVIGRNNLILRGVGEGRAKIPAAGKHSQGKAIWVNQGNDITMENIEFSGCRVPDGNGAGIRQEGVNLTVRNCKFYDCEDTILSGESPNSEILIEHCEFSHCGIMSNRGVITHNLYIGRIKKLVYRYNYSHHVRDGNLFKCRAKETHVLYNRVVDEADGRSSFVLDLPNGGKVYVIGNVLQKSSAALNTPFIAYGREGIKHAESELYVINNTMVSSRRKAIFMEISKVKQEFKLVARNNIFAGIGTVCNWSQAIMEGNWIGDDPSFVNPSAWDYRLQKGSPCINKGVDPGKAGGVVLKPTWQYVHPHAEEKRPDDGKIDIGAYEFRVE